MIRSTMKSQCKYLIHSLNCIMKIKTRNVPWTVLIKFPVQSLGSETEIVLRIWLTRLWNSTMWLAGFEMGKGLRFWRVSHKTTFTENEVKCIYGRNVVLSAWWIAHFNFWQIIVNIFTHWGIADNYIRKEIKMFSYVLTLNVEKLRLCHNLLKNKLCFHNQLSCGFLKMYKTFY